MQGLFFLSCIIEIIIQIVSIVKLKKTNDSKYWNIFIGITIATFISDALAYSVFANNALGLSDAIACLFICGFSFICNIILLIVGLIVKRIIKSVNIKLNRNSFFMFIVIIVINSIILFLLPIITSNITSKSWERHVINYLNNKYGNSNYRVINVYKEYSNSGMWDKYLSGFYYEIKSDYMEDTFIVSIDDNFNYIDADYFLPVYYSQKYNFNYSLEYDDWYTSVDYDFEEFDNYIKKIINEQYPMNSEKIDVRGIYSNYVQSWSSIDGVKYNSNYYIVSANNGKIPTTQELVNQLIKYNK